MQTPLAPPREGLTLPELERLLASPALFVGAGLERLSPTLQLLDDLTPWLAAGTVQHDLLATIHGSCELEVDLPLRWGRDLLRPYTVLTDGRVLARFDQGVYVPTTPRRRFGSDSFEVTGYDRLYLLDRLLPGDYDVPAGIGVLTLVEQAVADAGLSGILLDPSAAAQTLPELPGRSDGVALEWLLVPRTTDPDDSRTPATWLRVINDLLRTVGYRAVWCDEQGRYRSEPYVAPRERAAEWTFTDAPTGVPLGLEREQLEDVHQLPNLWTFVASNPPEGVVPTEANGLVYRYPLPAAHAQSAANRDGLVWPARYDYEVASPEALRSLGDRRVQTDLARAARFETTTRTFPLAGHADVLAYRDTEGGVDAKVQAVRSVVDLFGGDTAWTWEAAA